MKNTVGAWGAAVFLSVFSASAAQASADLSQAWLQAMGEISAQRASQPDLVVRKLQGVEANLNFSKDRLASAAALRLGVVIKHGTPNRVSALFTGLGADAAGVKVGDLLVKIAGVDVAAKPAEEVRAAIGRSAGPVPVTVERAGKTLELAIEARPLVDHESLKRYSKNLEILSKEYQACKTRVLAQDALKSSAQEELANLGMAVLMFGMEIEQTVSLKAIRDVRPAWPNMGGSLLL